VHTATAQDKHTAQQFMHAHPGSCCCAIGPHLQLLCCALVPTITQYAWLLHMVWSLTPRLTPPAAALGVPPAGKTIQTVAFLGSLYEVSPYRNISSSRRHLLVAVPTCC
jgi:hypothetical protein